VQKYTLTYQDRQAALDCLKRGDRDGFLAIHRLYAETHGKFTAEVSKSPECICQRMYDTGSVNYQHRHTTKTGHRVWVDVAALVADTVPEDAPSDWFERTVNAFSFGANWSDPDLRPSREGEDITEQYFHSYFGRYFPAPEWAVSAKNTIERHCPATLHYSRLTEQQLYAGRETLTSYDPEKQAELRDQMENDLFLASHPGEMRLRRENRGADAGAGRSDVLQRQRENAQAEQPTRISRDVVSFDTQVALDQMERKALRKVSDNKPSPFLRLVWANKHHARAKKDQARRDIFRYLQKLGVAQDPNAIAWVRGMVAKHGYLHTRKVLWTRKASELTKPAGEGVKAAA
jgi:hypothetical protein